MARYLITGVAGFIGSALARAVLAQGDEVWGIDNFATGKPENIAAVREQIDFHEADLLDLDALHRACRNVDFVLHQAAIPSVPRSVRDPVESNRVNIGGTLNVLLAARDAGVKRVVYAASSSVYGDSAVLPKREDMKPDPISPYAVAKLAGEQYMTSFYRCYGVETVSLRYFNIFGPRQDSGSPYSGVLAKFITQMLREEEPVIYGDGEQSRDFTFIENAVSANLLACRASADVAGRVFNVATGQRTTLNEMVESLRQITGYKGRVNYRPDREGDVKHSLADLSLARKYLKYIPEITFEKGLKKTVDWYAHEARVSVG